jgi:prepilin-type N-terminal cleavage/methylation domain-containing protein
MLQRLRERMGSESGFTLVELLVVMLILGILAAIAIPSFFNQRDKARDADAKASAKTAQTAIETYATENNGSYANADVGDLTRIEETLTPLGTDLAVVAADDTYTVTVTSETDNTFSVERTGTGAFLLNCTGGGGCPTDGTWD